MWKNILYITLGLYIFSSIGSLDVFYDSLSCFISVNYSENYKNFTAEILKDSELIDPLINVVETNFHLVSSIKTYTLDDAIKLTLEAIKNKSWENNQLIFKDVTANELIKNKLIFEQAFKNVCDLLKDQFIKSLQQ